MESLQRYTEPCGILDCSPKQLTVREQLNLQRTQLTERIETVNAALAALDKNPGVEEVLTLVGRTVRY